MLKKIALLGLLIFTVGCANKPETSFYKDVSDYKNLNYNNKDQSIELFIDNYILSNAKLYKKSAEEILELQEQVFASTTDLYILDKNSILNLLGIPNNYKLEKNLEIWNYKSEFCIINFIWDNNLKKIIYIYSYKSDKNDVNNRDCIKELVKVAKF